MKYRANLEIINSKRDRAGNCYYSFTYTDNETGKSVTAQTSSTSEGNVYQVKYKLFPEDPHCIFSFNTEMGVRPYEQMIKTLPHAGSQPAEIAKFITETLAKL